jgi:hypothetical protein
MRLPPVSAVTRRDDNLARTRKLSVRIAGAATTASFALAAALGFALPGHSFAARSRNAGSGPGSKGGTSTARGGATRSGNQHGGLTPPPQPPSTTTAPPVVTSGGS